MKTKHLLPVLLICIGISFFMTGCTEYNSLSASVEFTLSNGSNLETHMWIADESIGAANKVAPSGTRKLTRVYKFNTITEQKELEIYVGRNGQTIGYGTGKVTAATKKIIAFYDGTYLAVTSE